MRGLKPVFIMVLMLTAVLSSGCLTEGPEEKGYTYYDPLGGKVILEGEPERIVTLSPALTETVFALGLGSRVVATDNVSNYPEEAIHLPKVFSYTGLSAEALIMTDPDLVLMDRTLDISEEAYNAIKDLGIPVYRIYPRSMDDVLEALTGIGNITGAETNAAHMVDDIRSRMDAITLSLQDVDMDDRPEVLLVTYYDGLSDPWVSTASTMAGGLIRSAGGINMISDDTGIVVQVPVETIIDGDPDMIICTQSTVWPTSTRSTIMSDDRWKDITAVKEERVFDVNGDLVDRTGPRLIDGMEEIHALVLDLIEERS
ncbi:MAG: ABC transporter substrate-binding protein [Candidatus Thermoplasmatota archaeon]|nr:ABC transporter substrate-binding protein [Candidatus Thermoplasmatota archaeon]